MRVLEILLPKGVSDRSISPQQLRAIDVIQRRMDSYVDKIMDPNTSSAGKEFLKSRLRDEYYALKDVIPRIDVVAENKITPISEAVHKLPLTDEDFELVKKIMEKPIPAAIAPIYIQEVINDDELNDQLASLEETEPARDVRPLIAEWFDRVMPDQMRRFVSDEQDLPFARRGMLSPIHGYDPQMYKGTNDPITGNAYGRFV